MNIVFFSPHFPPNYYLFCMRLRALGANVLGLADQPDESLSPELQAALNDYYQVSDLHSYDELLRALGYFTHRHGKIDRIDSLNEYWLETEARLRTDFNIEGLKLADMPVIKRKSEMKRRFSQTGLQVARGVVADDPQVVRTLAHEVGFPLVAKPDTGVGANETFKLQNEAELETFLARGLPNYFVEQFVRGTIVTYDGLADRNGVPVFFTSMEYSQGVMDVVNQDDDIYFFTQRHVPADIQAAGRAILEAFAVRERFFHFEFFRTPEGQLIALEVNMRPPGGLCLDMFNFAHEIDLYREWAYMLIHGQITARWAAEYYVCYAGRKHGKAYRHSHEEILQRYGQFIVHHQAMPAVFRRAMGDYGYVSRSPNLDEAVSVARDIQTLR